MASRSALPPAGTASVKSFEAIADGIMYRWSVERDTWVSRAEVEQVRAYLERKGIVTRALPDGRFSVETGTAETLGAARLVLLGLRHLHAARRARTSDRSDAVR
ncbi:MAG TPA: hypothetical protein VFD84_04480 [Candidatus Binatia bacterium]|jgi:hypothetical protein|nr:hypothetical protein [Candidatus Binatia bacterium]